MRLHLLIFNCLLLSQLIASPPEVEILRYMDDAKKGDPSAQTVVGRFYWYGGHDLRSGPSIKGYKKALPWFEKAAKQGYPQGQHDLALTKIMLSSWTKSKKLEKEGLDLMLRYAKLGNHFAQFYFGFNNYLSKPIESYVWLKVGSINEKIYNKKKGLKGVYEQVIGDGLLASDNLEIQTDISDDEDFDFDFKADNKNVYSAERLSKEIYSEFDEKQKLLAKELLQKYLKYKIGTK